MTAVTERPRPASGEQTALLPWLREPADRPFSVEDLVAAPDDGRRYEVIDGALLVTPAPRVLHQRVVFALARLLHKAAPPDLEVLPGVAVRPTPARLVIPDVLVARRADAAHGATGPPVLVVEVRSPSTALLDRTVKMRVYADAGVPSYWIVDPDEPSLTAWALRDGDYADADAAAGEEVFTASLPFPVSVVPSRLTA